MIIRFLATLLILAKLSLVLAGSGLAPTGGQPELVLWAGAEIVSDPKQPGPADPAATDTRPANRPSTRFVTLRLPAGRRAQGARRTRPAARAPPLRTEA